MALPFFYRDLSDLLSRNRKLELHFKQIVAHKIKVAQQLCMGLRGETQVLFKRLTEEYLKKLK